PQQGDGRGLVGHDRATAKRKGLIATRCLLACQYHHGLSHWRDDCSRKERALRGAEEPVGATLNSWFAGAATAFVTPIALANRLPRVVKPLASPLTDPLQSDILRCAPGP